MVTPIGEFPQFPPASFFTACCILEQPFSTNAAPGDGQAGLFLAPLPSCKPQGAAEETTKSHLQKTSKSARSLLVHCANRPEQALLLSVTVSAPQPPLHVPRLGARNKKLQQPSWRAPSAWAAGSQPCLAASGLARRHASSRARAVRDLS